MRAMFWVDFSGQYHGNSRGIINRFVQGVDGSVARIGMYVAVVDHMVT
jgi:hypothetical protein